VRTAVLSGLLGALGWLCTVPSATAASLTADVDGMRVDLRSEPESPARDRMTTYVLRLFESTGKPVTEARVTLTARMADGMSAAAALRPSGDPGVYRGQILFTMEGSWELTLRVARQGQRFGLPLVESVGR
jgi:hypothetical protein